MAPSDSTCWSLVRGAAAGRPQDRDDFARLYATLVRAYLTARWTGTPRLEDVEDAVQEVFLDCFRDGGALARYEGGRSGGFRAFLHGVTRVVALRFERSESRRNAGLRADIDLERLEEDSPSLSRLFDRSWATALLHEASRALARRAEAEGPDALRRMDLLRAWRRDLLPEIASYASVEAAIGDPQVLVAEGDEWRYFRGVKAPSAGLEWTRTDFDDRSWEVGESGFGYGDGDDRTVLTDMQGNYSSVYLRRSVEIDDPSRYHRFLLRVVADDGFVAYLNGDVVGAARLDPRNTALDALADDATEPVAPIEIDVSGKLRGGSNLFAIRGVNSNLRSSDLSVIPEVLAEPVREPAAEALRVEELRSELASRGERALAGYLEGLWLERRGDLALAAERLLEVVRLDRSSAPPFQRLWSVLVNLHGRDRARQLFRAALERGLPVGWISAPFEYTGTIRAEETPRGVELSIGEAPWHPDPRMRIGETRWQVRAEGGRYDRDAVFDVTTGGDVTRVVLPRHRLLPDSVYLCRVTWYSSDATAVTASDERRFTTGHYPFESIPVDLSPRFSGDFVVNPGDEENAPIDGGQGFLVVEGYDGQHQGVSTIQGFPADGKVGIHRLADYDGPNAIELSLLAGAPVRVDVRPRRYSAFRFLATAGHGDAAVPVTFLYSDGTSDVVLLHIQDWFDDPGAGANQEGDPLTFDTTPVRNGMDRLYGGHFEDSKDAALFETTLTVDPRKVVVAFVLETPRTERSNEATRAGIFAITGVWAEDAR